MAYLGVCVFHDVEHGATTDEGHDHPQVRPMYKRGVQWQHIGMMVVPHQLRLVHNLVQVGMHTLQVHLLDSDNFIHGLAVGLVHCGTDALATVLQQLIGFSPWRVLLAQGCKVLGRLAEDACAARMCMAPQSRCGSGQETNHRPTACGFRIAAPCPSAPLRGLQAVLRLTPDF